MNNKLNKLPQELINQIAAGEVIERPASIVKELVDNSIDAGASKITVKIVDGGIESIEVIDNGIGIIKEELAKVFEAHTTSKIESIEDLNNVITMGFRGEALSTIVSVAKVEAISKHKDEEVGYKVSFDGINPLPITKEPKEQGTSIKVSNLFYNIPARRKFLKTPETEYRKVLETLIPITLVYGNIHFVLFRNNKEILNLPKISDKVGLNIDRIKRVVKGEYVNRMFEIHAQGAGITIGGYCAHPKDNIDKNKDQYIFVNRRPIWDFGIAKSVRNAYSRYIPNNQKVPFIISVDIDPKLIDVNVHPRKEEIRFENPFRVYSVIEDAITNQLESVTREDNSFTTTNLMDSSSRTYSPFTPEYKAREPISTVSKEIRFSKPSSEYSVQQGLDFSKEIIEMKKESESNQTESNNQENYQQNTSNIDINKVFQIFNKYIVIEVGSELIMIDQHAAAERINFEKLESSLESKNLDIQNLLIPATLSASEVERSYLVENLSFFKSLGFTINIAEESIDITSIPSIFSGENIENLFRKIFDISGNERDLKSSFEEAKGNILATLACHGSIRKGQSLTPYEGVQLYKDLLKCKNPYSCPHGRPIVWKQRLEEIDTNFYRTY